MKSLALISLFQQKLDVSRTNAIWRVLGAFVASVSFVITLILAATTFPTKPSFTETVMLLPGNYTQVAKILDGDVLVDKAKFLQMAEGNTTFVSSQPEAIVYMAKVGGISYRYEEKATRYKAYDLTSSHIENGALIREMTRDWPHVVFNHIFFPLLVLFLCFWAFLLLQTKKVSGWGSSARFVEVWI